MSLTTDAEMAVPNRGRINPEPQSGMQPPKSIGSESVVTISKPVTLDSVAGVSMSVPNTIAAKPVSEFAPSAPNDLTPEAGFDMAVPNAIGNVAAGAVTAPITLTAETADSIAAPVARASVTQTAFPRIEG